MKLKDLKLDQLCSSGTPNEILRLHLSIILHEPVSLTFLNEVIEKYPSYFEKDEESDSRKESIDKLLSSNRCISSTPLSVAYLHNTK